MLTVCVYMLPYVRLSSTDRQYISPNTVLQSDLAVTLTGLERQESAGKRERLVPDETLKEHEEGQS